MALGQSFNSLDRFGLHTGDSPYVVPLIGVVVVSTVLYVIYVVSDVLEEAVNLFIADFMY